MEMYFWLSLSKKLAIKALGFPIVKTCFKINRDKIKLIKNQARFLRDSQIN